MLIIFPILAYNKYDNHCSKKRKQKTRKEEPSVLGSLYNSLIYNSIMKAGAKFCLYR